MSRLFDSYYNQAVMPQDTSLAPCKPDYEDMIKRNRVESKAITDFLKAMENLESMHIQLESSDSLLIVIGKMFLRQQELQRRVMELIDAQENEKEKNK